MTDTAANIEASSSPGPWPAAMPRGLGLLGAGVGALSAIGFVGLAAAAVFGSVGFQPLPFALAFVGALSGVLAVLTGLGRYPQGPAMALGILAGCVVGSAGLARLIMLADAGALPRDLFLLGQTGAGLALAGLAVATVLAREPSEIKRLLFGVALGSVAVAMLGFVLVGPGRAVLSPVEGPLEIARLMGLMAGALVLGVLVSVGGHLVITAFERAGDARPDRRPQTPPEDA